MSTSQLPERDTDTDDRPANPPPPTTRRPRRSLLWGLPILLVIIWSVIGGIGGQAQSKLSGVQTLDGTAFLPSSSESVEIAKEQKKFATGNVIPAILVFERGSGLTDADRTLITDRAKAVSTMAGLGAPASPPIPSDDGKAVEMVVPLNLDTGLDGEVAWLRGHAADNLPSGLSAHVTGPAALLTDLLDSFASIDGPLLLVTAGLVALIVLLVYRSPVLLVAILGTAITALSLAGLVVYQLAKNNVLPLNGQSQGILLILVFGATTDYCFLLVSRYREELRRTRYAWDAMWRALRGVIAPITASAGTVILGLLCFTLSELGSNRSLGPITAMGIAASYLAALTMLPVVLLPFRRAAFWPARPKLGSVGTAERGLWLRIANAVGKRPRSTWALGVLVLLVGVLFVPQIRANGVSDTDQFLVPVDSVTGQDTLNRHFPAGSGSPVVITGKAGAIDEMLAVTRSHAGIASAAETTTAPAGQPPSAPPAPVKIVDGRAEITATLNDPADSDAAVDVVQSLRADLHKIPDSEVDVGGRTAEQLDRRDGAIHDRNLIMVVTLAVIFLVLLVLLRSLLLPLVLLGTVVLSYGATLGLSALAFNDVFKFPGADPSIPLFGFVFLVSLGVDYNIFLMSRVREEVGVLGARAGTIRGLAVTGGVITSAGIVLAATCAALLVIPNLFLAQVAFMVSIGVLIDTLLVRSLVVPGLVIHLGRAVWWPSRLARGLR